MRLMDLLCVCLGVRQVQLMGNWDGQKFWPPETPADVVRSCHRRPISSSFFPLALQRPSFILLWTVE